MPINTETALYGTGGGVAAILMIFKIGKYMMQQVRMDKIESTVVAADVASYKRLLEEITRQGVELAKQRKLINLLYRKMDSLREMEIEAATDLGMLTVHIKNMPCGGCGAPDDTFADIEVILDRMKHRRERKREVFSDMPTEDELNEATK